MADQQTDENKNTSSAKSEGGDEAEKKRRRRRRGKRRPDREQAEGGAETSTNEGSEAPSKEETSSSDDSKNEGKGEDRKRRPNRRKKKKPQTEEGEAAPQDAQAKETDSGKSEKKDRPKRGDKKKKDDKGEKSEKQGRNGKPGKGEKKERPKRGSVLDRRKTRGETVLEFPDDDDPIIPVAPKPTAKTVDAYIKHLRGWQREVVSTLRSIIKDQASEATEEILWSQPVYTLDGPVVYIKAFSDHVNLGFWRGNEIEDTSQRLIGEMPTMRHVTIRAVNEMDRDLFEDLVRQAFRLNKERGNAIK